MIDYRPVIEENVPEKNFRPNNRRYAPDRLKSFYA